LAGAGFDVTTLEIPAGEDHKTLDEAGRLYRELTGAYAERSTPVLALGGGVVGDLAGFVAATYLRGLPLVQLPTTLLAQVDSSIGGKTAVDYGNLKNMIGVFYQPRLVAADIDALKTLPEIELANGMAEAIKTGAIMSRGLFEYIEKNVEKATAADTAVLEEIVYQSARLKAEVVAGDEKESDRRAILNYGHTVGHAIEAVSGFALKHGQAVAIGMVAEAEISRRMGLLDEDSVTRLRGVLERAGLPVAVPALDIKGLMAAMRHDKKVVGDTVRFVLLKAIGQALISDDVGPELVEEVLNSRE
jgi:3-dehydroquinate synthase